jgi:hypothetical protein
VTKTYTHMNKDIFREMQLQSKKCCSNRSSTGVKTSNISSDCYYHCTLKAEQHLCCAVNKTASSYRVF